MRIIAVLAFWFFSCLHASILNEFPYLGMNGNGNTVVVWQAYQNDGSHLKIVAASLPKGGVWGSPIDLSSMGKTAIYPKISMDPIGNMISVWEAKNSSNFSIQAVSGLFSDFKWDSITTISENASDDTFPEIDIDVNGNGTLLWQKKAEGGYIVRTAYYSADRSTWSDPVSINPPSRTMPLPEVVTNSTGKTLAFWQQFIQNANVIQTSSRNLDGSWTPPVNLSDPNFNATNAQGAINEMGEAVAIWQKGTESGVSIEARLYSLSGEWGETQTLSLPNSISTYPLVAISPEGKILAIWQTSGSMQGIQTAVYSDGVWGSPISISDGSLNAATPYLAMNSLGEAIAIWNANGIIQAAIMSKENRWSDPTSLSDPTATALYPQVGIDDEGNGVAVWQAAIASTKQIEASVYSKDHSWSARRVISE